MKHVGRKRGGGPGGRRWYNIRRFSTAILRRALYTRVAGSLLLPVMQQSVVCCHAYELPGAEVVLGWPRWASCAVRRRALRKTQDKVGWSGGRTAVRPGPQATPANKAGAPGGDCGPPAGGDRGSEQTTGPCPCVTCASLGRLPSQSSCTVARLLPSPRRAPSPAGRGRRGAQQAGQQGGSVRLDEPGARAAYALAAGPAPKQPSGCATLHS